MSPGGIEVQVPQEHDRRVLGVAVEEPEQAEADHQNERSLRRLEQRDHAQARSDGVGLWNRRWDRGQG